MKELSLINYFKIFTICIFSLLYIYIGIKHFVDPDPFMAIMPNIIPIYLHKFFVYISGFFEIYFGLLILHKEERKFGAWGLIILLFAVFPANIYLAITNGAALNTTPLVAWGRLPFQFIFIAIAYWHSTI